MMTASAKCSRCEETAYFFEPRNGQSRNEDGSVNNDGEWLCGAHTSKNGTNPGPVIIDEVTPFPAVKRDSKKSIQEQALEINFPDEKDREIVRQQMAKGQRGSYGGIKRSLLRKMQRDERKKQNKKLF